MEDFNVSDFIEYLKSDEARDIIVGKQEASKPERAFAREVKRQKCLVRPKRSLQVIEGYCPINDGFTTFFSVFP